MSPAEHAAAVYEKEDCPRTFLEDLALHLENGYVHSTPEFFVLARTVWLSPAEPDYASITDPECIFEKANCWHIYLAAGDLTQAAALIPKELQWVSFERKNVLRFYPFAAFMRRLKTSSTPLKPHHHG